jgi:hypothetical protein
LDVGTKAWPPIIPLNKFLSLEAAGVARCGMIMKPVEEVMTRGRGNISTILVIQNGVHNFPIQQCRLHRWETEAIQCIRGSGENRVRGGVIGGQGIMKRIVEKSDKHGMRKKCDVSVIGIHGMMVRPAR